MYRLPEGGKLMLDNLKSFGWGLIVLLVALIILMMALRLLRKVPVIGPIAGDAQDLATQGQL